MYPEYEYRDAAFRIHRGHSCGAYPVRFHKHVELLHVVSGFMEIVIDGEAYRLQSGDSYVVFPNLPHAVRQSDALRCMMIISPEVFPAFLETLSRSKPVCPVLRGADGSELIPLLFLRMLELHSSDPQKHYGILCSYANALLGEWLLRMELTERSSDGDLVQKLVMFLLEHYTEEISLEAAAAALGYSKYHISHIVSETFGCHFRALLNDYRIGMAQNLLLSTEQSIGEVAYACGFRNQSSFNRVFLQHCGQTPGEYRRRTEHVPEEPRLHLK